MQFERKQTKSSRFAEVPDTVKPFTIYPDR